MVVDFASLKFTLSHHFSETERLDTLHTMKRFFTRADTPSATFSGPYRILRPIIKLLSVTLLTTSCIFDAPDDTFYRTLWVCKEPPLEALTIEFLCGSSVSATAPRATGSYGTYDPHGNTVIFANLRLNSYLDSTPLVIILEEAHRTDDLLLLNWHYSDSPVSYTSRLIRKGSYE